MDQKPGIQLNRMLYFLVALTQGTLFYFCHRPQICCKIARREGRHPATAMSKLLAVIFYICHSNLMVRASDQIFDIDTIEDEAVRARFDEYDLVSEVKRPSTICPVSSRGDKLMITLLYISCQNATEVEEIRLIDGKKYSKLAIIDIDIMVEFLDKSTGVTNIKKLRQAVDRALYRC